MTDSQSTEFIIPPLDNSNFDTFVFFCYTSPPRTGIHAINQQRFFNQVLFADLQERKGVFVCLIQNNVHWHPRMRTIEWVKRSSVVKLHRPNVGFDFGGFADAALFTGLPNRYADFHLLCLNDTVYGPMIPWWINPQPDWLQILKNLITTEVKLAGLTINSYKMNPPHVQTMLFITDRIGFNIGWEHDVFVARLDKEIVVTASECAFSQAVLNKGFNIDCLATLLHGLDWRKASISSNLIPDRGDVCYPGKYIPDCDMDSVHPFDSMFCKTTRLGVRACLAFTRANVRAKLIPLQRKQDV